MSSPQARGHCDVDTQTIVVRITGRLTPADARLLCSHLRTRLENTSVTEVIADVSALTPADLSTVDALARLSLTARRAGCELRLGQAPQRLRGLLDLVGLGLEDGPRGS
ncbi:STAS domain-containing protein [Streptomyces sp. NPDC057638]|uniref:STAS domain-containing protein n=1 Tax=Streptomyces sp. NPDC057638 TaxID=3346190 RepID=UPI003683EEE7